MGRKGIGLFAIVLLIIGVLVLVFFVPKAQAGVILDEKVGFDQKFEFIDCFPEDCFASGESDEDSSEEGPEESGIAHKPQSPPIRIHSIYLM